MSDDGAFASTNPFADSVSPPDVGGNPGGPTRTDNPFASNSGSASWGGDGSDAGGLDFEQGPKVDGFGIGAVGVAAPSNPVGGKGPTFDDDDDDGTGGGSRGGGGAFYSLDYYKQWFDVDTRDVGARLVSALFPIKANFLDLISAPKADAYGPFWIGSTVIVMMSITGNLASLINAQRRGESADWSYDFDKVTFALSLIYGYITVLPLCIGLGFKWFLVNLKLMEVVCLFGYSLAIWVPTALVCLIPSEAIRWAAVGVALLVSTTFLLRNLWGSADQAQAKMILVAIGFVQVGLALVLKLYFFEYASLDGSGSGAGPTATPVVVATTAAPS